MTGFFINYVSCYVLGIRTLFASRGQDLVVATTVPPLVG